MAEKAHFVMAEDRKCEMLYFGDVVDVPESAFQA